jgi:outer membrane protein TolC
MKKINSSGILLFGTLLFATFFVESVFSAERGLQADLQASAADKNNTRSTFRLALHKAFYEGRPLENLNLIEMDRGKTLSEALARNLEIKNVILSKEISGAALENAKSQLDLYVSQSLSDSRSGVFERVVREAEYKSTVTCVNPDAPTREAKECIKINPPNPGVFNMWYDQARPQGYYQSNIYASEPPETGIDNSQRYRVQLNKQFSNGVNGFISNTLMRKDYLYIEKYGFDLIDSYNRQWTNNVSIGLSTPLPGTRYFGALAPVDIAIKIADFNQIGTFWNMQSAINNILTGIERAYWNLTLAYKRYQVTLASKERLSKQLEKTRRMFSLQEVTRYDKAVVEAQFASLGRQESEVLNNFILASNVLVDLLDYSQDAVILPQDEDLSVADSGPIEMQDIVRDSVLYNPKLQLAKVNVGIAMMLHEQSAGLLKPDMSVSATLSSNQSNAVYGFHGPLDAVGKALNPDSATQNYSFIYNRQWNNVSAKTALEINESRVRQQEIMLAQTRRTVAGQIVVAVASVQSMNERVEIAKQEMEMARTVFFRAEKQRNLGVINDFELALKLQDLRSAELAYESVLVSRRIAEVEVRQAAGAMWRKDSFNGAGP